jgi:ribosomal protein S18 acetylase RimI-like enzyme
MASAEIRTAEACDAGVAARLLFDFNTEFGDETPPPDELAGRVEELLAGGDTAVLLGSAGAEPVAVAVLAELYVAPAERGHGLGRALLEAAIELARREGADYMDLGTSEDDVVARKLYERLGFSRTEGRADGPLNYYYERDL